MKSTTLEVLQIISHYNLNCIKLLFFSNPKSEYNRTPISEAVI